MIRRVVARGVAFLAVVLLAGTVWAADIAIPPLTGRVVDLASVLSNAEEARLATNSADLEARTGHQLVIVTLSDLDGHSIERWGLELGRGWGIGQSGRDDGVILIVAPNDREVRIEVGYGLEDRLTDAKAGRIIRNVILPRFKAGDLPDGISDGVDAIIRVLSGSSETFERPRGINPAWFILGMFGLWVVGAASMIYSAVRNIRRGSVIRRSDDDDDDDRSSRSDRDDRDSFRGGGGSFGGGGASGRW